MQNDAKDLKTEKKNPGTWYSSESAPQELSNEYQHDRVLMVFKNLCVILIRTKVAIALEGLIDKRRSKEDFERSGTRDDSLAR